MHLIYMGYSISQRDEKCLFSSAGEFLGYYVSVFGSECGGVAETKRRSEQNPRKNRRHTPDPSPRGELKAQDNCVDPFARTNRFDLSMVGSNTLTHLHHINIKQLPQLVYF